MLKVGDWVLSDTDCLGYVTKISSNSQIAVKLVSNKYGHKMKMTVFKYIGQLKPAPTSTPDKDLYHLIDLALKMNDKEWFLDLTNELGVIRDGSISK